MIYFITPIKEEYSSLINTSVFTDITILNEEEGKALFYKTLRGKKNVYLDTETNGLDPFVNKVLLTGIKLNSSYFCFDYFCDIKDIIEAITKKYVIGHNLKFDIKMLYGKTGILIKKLYDTMIAEQRLFMGTDYNYGYDALIERYLQKVIFKGVREEFINVNPVQFRVTTRHLYYLKSDLESLPIIKEKQKALIHKWKMQFLIYGIENPLVSVLANAELRGFHLNKDKWKERVKEQINKRFNILNQLDNEVKRLKETLPNVKKEYLSGGKWDKKRISNPLYYLADTKGNIEIPNLFEDTSRTVDLLKGKSKKVTSTIKKIEEYPGCVSYTKAEIIHIIASLNEVAITEYEQFSIPKFLEKGKIDFNYYSIKESVLERYLILKPNSPLKEFLLLITKLQKINKAIDTYGNPFIDKINPVTNRIHTIFRQCFAETGRLQSGGGKKEPDKYNAQNIPRDKSFREPFEGGKGRLIETSDYSGAELIVLASHSQELRLIELDKQDIHSYFATKSWKRIFKYRADEVHKYLIDSKDSENTEKLQKDYEELLYKSVNFQVTKTKPEGYRQAFKPMAFNTIFSF